MNTCTYLAQVVLEAPEPAAYFTTYRIIGSLMLAPVIFLVSGSIYGLIRYRGDSQDLSECVDWGLADFCDAWELAWNYFLYGVVPVVLLIGWIGLAAWFLTIRTS